MNSPSINDILIRPLSQNESIPYNLLLLADPSKDIIDKYISSAEVYIAALKENIVGAYVLYPVNPDTVEIKNIAVDPKHQGNGIGKLLLTDAAKTAKDKGFNRIIIGTANASIAQLYLYQKQGFEITEIKKFLPQTL